MSWLILRPNGTWRNRYLPRCMLNVVSKDACSVRCIPENALFPSTLENVVAPVNSWAISSRVSALWFSLMIALFRSFGSRQILNLLLGFFQICQWAYPWCQLCLFCNDSLLDHVIQLFLNLSFVFDGHLASTGGTLGSILMSYSPDLLPIWLKELGYRVCKSFVLLIWMLPGST